jgi:hypothetical protein
LETHAQLRGRDRRLEEALIARREAAPVDPGHPRRVEPRGRVVDDL